MGKNEFINELVTLVAMSLPPSFGDVVMDIKEVDGYNGRTYNALLIHDEENNVSPSIDVDALYQDFQAGRSMVDMVDTIVKIKMTETVALDQMNLDAIYSFEEAKDHISIRMSDPERNEKYLEDAICRPYGDLVATYSISLQNIGDQYYSTKITEDMLKSWNVTEDELYQAAMDNMKPEVYSMDDMLFGMLENGFRENLLEHEGPLLDASLGFQPPLLILTNNSQMFGAACMVDTEVMKKLCELVGNVNGYILPSSQHEIIFVPESDQYSLADLENMVKEVNSTVVDSSDILTDKVQHCDKDTGLFMNAREYEQQKQMNQEKKTTPKINQGPKI